MPVRLSGLLDLVYPAVCVICRNKLSGGPEKNLLICPGCYGKIKRNIAPYCAKCGRSLRGLTQDVKICWECADKNFQYERAWAGFMYEGPVKEGLHLLKYAKRLSLSGLFCGLLLEFLKEMPEIYEGTDGVAAVPLASVKYRERGFNQAHLLAAAISREFKIRDLSGCLKRSVSTLPQSRLDKKERFENVKGTFEVMRPELIKQKSLLIVDDLFTTGATLNECAKVLKTAGAGRIRVLSFARGA